MANFQLQDSQKVPYAVFESDAKGNIDPPDPGDTVVLSTSDSGSVTVAPDPAVDAAKVPAGADPATCLQTGFLVGGTKVQTGVAITATFAHTDGSKPPAPAVDLIDLIVGPATTGTISLGAPVNQ